MPDPVRLIVNGTQHDLTVDPTWRLLTVLRDVLGLTGTKYGCGEGECGACTVLVGGRGQGAGSQSRRSDAPVAAAPRSPVSGVPDQPLAVKSCVATLADVAGATITTIEGLAGDQLHPAQQAFAESGAMQCGFCTPGLIMRTAALLAETNDPTDDQIHDALQGNICRCGTYPRILRAVRAAGRKAKGERRSSEFSVLSSSEPTQNSELRTQNSSHPSPFALRPSTAPWATLAPNDRDYTALGDGIVVVSPQLPLPPDRPAPTGVWAAHGGAWLHLGGNGTITGFTGKVDVGQDNRSALTLLIAEELGAPVESIRLVMADTDHTPHDPGTFGSRSMPDAGQTVRIVAAAARERLIRRAAERWRVTPEELLARDGQIAHRQDGRTIPFGDLVASDQTIETAAPETALKPPATWQQAGHTAPRVSAGAVITGAKQFPSDIHRPGMLHGAILRPPGYGATLRSADLTRARAIEGAIVVRDGSFIGAAAADPFTARKAIKAVATEWDRPQQPSDRDLESILRATALPDPVVQHQTGDIVPAFGSADFTHEATYTVPYLAHAPLETRVAVAEWHDGRLTVWTGSQRPFGVAAELAAALGVPETSVQVIIPDTGAAFGGKHTGEVAIEAARLARAAGRPVRVMWSREEEFTWGYFRPAAVVDIRSAARRDGTMLAWQHTTYNAGGAGILTPYAVPNQQIRALASQPPLRQGSYRALGATANTFARESHLDELAQALGIDPLEIRLRNLRDDRLIAVLRAVADRADWSISRPGRGIALGTEKGGRVATYVEVDASLRLTRVVTAFECGAIVQPDNLVNQIEGAMVMGIGGALREAIRFEGGRVRNPRFSQYRVPRLSDIPPIEVILLDRPDLPPAGGGETPIITVAPAIANAIFAATGDRRRALPLEKSEE